MTPEQARGKAVDKRADIWAFGAVLYEMLTGRRAFEGETVSDTLAAVLMREPDWSALPAPAAVARSGGCSRAASSATRSSACATSATRGSRWRKIRGRGALVTPNGSPVSGSPRSGRRGLLRDRRRICDHGRRVRRRPPAVAAPHGCWPAVGRAGGAVVEFTQLTDASGVETGPSVSPDGTSFAYSSAARGSWDIYVQRVGGRNPVLVAGDPAATRCGRRFRPTASRSRSARAARAASSSSAPRANRARRLTDVGSNPALVARRPAHRVLFGRSPERVRHEHRERALDRRRRTAARPAKLEVGARRFSRPGRPRARRIAFWTNVNGQRDLATIPAAGGSRVMVTSDVAADWAPVWSPDGRFLSFASDRGGSMGIWRIAHGRGHRAAPTGAPRAHRGRRGRRDGPAASIGRRQHARVPLDDPVGQPGRDRVRTGDRTRRQREAPAAQHRAPGPFRRLARRQVDGALQPARDASRTSSSCGPMAASCRA